MNDGDLDRFIADVDGGFLEIIKAANRLKFERLRFAAGELFVDGPERRFHDAAGHAEDRARARAGAERRIKFAFRQILEIQADVFDELYQLARRQYGVYVWMPVASHLRARRFKFFRGAGHDGDGKDPFDGNAHRLGVIGLGNGAEHAHRRFSGREMGKQLGVMFFDEIDPARAARSQHGKDTAVLQAINKLGSFFHNGEVGAEVRIKNPIKAEHAECRDHLPGSDSAGSEAKSVAEGNAHRRSGLYDNVKGWIL